MAVMFLPNPGKQQAVNIGMPIREPGIPYPRITICRLLGTNYPAGPSTEFKIVPHKSLPACLPAGKLRYRI